MDDPKRAEVFLSKLVASEGITDYEKHGLQIALYLDYETDIFGLSDF